MKTISIKKVFKKDINKATKVIRRGNNYRFEYAFKDHIFLLDNFSSSDIYGRLIHSSKSKGTSVLKLYVFSKKDFVNEVYEYLNKVLPKKG